MILWAGIRLNLEDYLIFFGWLPSTTLITMISAGNYLPLSSWRHKIH